VTLLDDAVRLLSGWRAPDARQERLRREYVAHLLAHPDGLERSCLPDHVTASTLVLSPDGERVLLTLHAKAGAWFQLGGHTEPADATLAGAALREAREESGLEGLELDPVPVQLDRHEVPFCGGRPGTRHLDVRFLAVATAGTRSAVSEESVDVRWWPAAALPSQELSLRELVHLGRDRLGHRLRLERL
jgi:8-oxo-dGTP pyrophosphatase MutT (NUDIX family)